MQKASIWRMHKAWNWLGCQGIAFLMLNALSVLQALVMSRSCVNEIEMFVSRYYRIRLYAKLLASCMFRLSVPDADAIKGLLLLLCPAQSSNMNMHALHRKSCTRISSGSRSKSCSYYEFMQFAINIQYKRALQRKKQSSSLVMSCPVQQHEHARTP